MRERGGKVKAGTAAGVEGRTNGRRLHSGSKESGVHATAQRRDEFGSAGGVAGFGRVAGRACETIAPDPCSGPFPTLAT